MIVSNGVVEMTILSVIFQQGDSRDEKGGQGRLVDLVGWKSWDMGKVNGGIWMGVYKGMGIGMCMGIS